MGRWSIEGDLPKLLSRLENVNHFIVSQTNPHVLPIVRVKSGGGLLGKLVGQYSLARFNQDTYWRFAKTWHLRTGQRPYLGERKTSSRKTMKVTSTFIQTFDWTYTNS